MVARLAGMLPVRRVEAPQIAFFSATLAGDGL
jgi:hypothetical protein